MKLCYWDSIYGIYPPERAFRPDDEVGAIDSEGNWICDRCAQKYGKAKAEAEAEAQMAQRKTESDGQNHET